MSRKPWNDNPKRIWKKLKREKKGVIVPQVFLFHLLVIFHGIPEQDWLKNKRKGQPILKEEESHKREDIIDSPPVQPSFSF